MKARIVLPAIYGVLFFAALIVMFSTADQTALCGIYVALLTIPWSLLAVLIFSIIWPGLFESSTLPTTLIVILCGLLNGGIAFLIGAHMDGFWRSKRN